MNTITPHIKPRMKATKLSGIIVLITIPVIAIHTPRNTLILLNFIVFNAIAYLFYLFIMRSSRPTSFYNPVITTVRTCTPHQFTVIIPNISTSLTLCFYHDNKNKTNNIYDYRFLTHDFNNWHSHSFQFTPWSASGT